MRGRVGGKGTRAILAVGLLLAFSAVVGSAVAERVQHGPLIASINGGISPTELPRHRAAPVAVRLRGRVTTADRSPLPRVNWIRLELGW